jgi:hypothetical protein
LRKSIKSLAVAPSRWTNERESLPEAPLSGSPLNLIFRFRSTYKRNSLEGLARKAEICSKTFKTATREHVARRKKGKKARVIPFLSYTYRKPFQVIEKKIFQHIKVSTSLTCSQMNKTSADDFLPAETFFPLINLFRGICF